MYKRTEKNYPTFANKKHKSPPHLKWAGIFTYNFLNNVILKWQNWRMENRIRIERNVNSGNHAAYRHNLHTVKTLRREGRTLAKLVAGLAKDPDNMERLGDVTYFLVCNGDGLFGRGFGKFPQVRAAYDTFQRIGREWKHVPWASTTWFIQSPLYCTHAAHVSESDPTMLAYTQNVDKLKRNIQTKIRPGRYLTKYFPHLSEGEVREWAHKFEAQNKPRELSFVENTDPDAWVVVYGYPVQASNSSAPSCMTGSDSVRVYADPENDLVLIVVWAEVDGADAVIARAIGNRKKKQYVRAYTNREYLSSNTFEQLLESNGWERDTCCLEGQCLTLEGSGDSIVCPYIDGSYQYVEKYGDFLVIGDSGYDANNTSGYCSGSMRCCDNCGDSMSEYGENFLDRLDIVVCEACVNDHYVEAYGRNDYKEWYHAEDDNLVEIDGVWYDTRYAERHGIEQCDDSCDWYMSEDMVTLACGDRVYDGSSRITMLDVESEDEGSMWAYESDAVELGDGRIAYELDTTELSDGTIVLECEEEELQAELDERLAEEAEAEAERLAEEAEAEAERLAEEAEAAAERLAEEAEAEAERLAEASSDTPMYWPLAAAQAQEQRVAMIQE